ncbi:hypothetical protein VX159_09380 [Dechloromonas sp. ZY10]|uniref:hypothetical protein n=1 Tax=Dechloromonas aquae TaxID=2664436 RepID=UPI0035279D98
MKLQYSPWPAHASGNRMLPGCDALILLGASCQGPEIYSQVAVELGYGPLRMPVPCDSESIRAQLEACVSQPPGVGGRTWH